MQLKRLSMLLSLCLWASLTGCGAKIPPTHYYTFAPHAESMAQQPAAASVPAMLGLAAFDANAPYQQDKIVFRTSPYEVNFYEYHKWLRPPTDIVTETVRQQIAAARLFRAVQDDDARTDYLLRGRILMFDQWYIEQRSSEIRIEIRYQLQEAEDERTIWTETIATKATTPSLDILGTIQAFETALQQNIRQAITGMEHALAHTDGAGD